MTVQAKIIADSINERGTRVTTFELEYPRIIHSELMTHRVFSRNAASSRAIPVKTMIDLIEANPAMPSQWGKNQPGMQAKEELDSVSKESVKQLWLHACSDAVAHARVMNDVGAHKQVINRITEPYQHMKVVLTATNYANWFYLRDHVDADPTIAELAAKMKYEYDYNEPYWLEEGAWHLPYVRTQKANGTFPQRYWDELGTQRYWDELGNQITLEQALMISVSSCAQVSYRKSDGSLEKAEVVYKRLIESKPTHASPTEHQCQVFESKDSVYPEDWPEGITHIDRNGVLWSGNIRDWIQYRQLIPNNVKLEQGE
jgi:thymidylate synthase ThyX